MKKNLNANMNRPRRLLALAALTTLSFPLMSGVASAQSTQGPPATTTAPTASPTTAKPSAPALSRMIRPGDLVFQKANKSSEIAAGNTQSADKTAWEVISADAALSEFAELVRAAGLEKLFSRTDSTSTYVLPNNDAFAVLDRGQLDRLKEPRFSEQAGSIVRQTISSGRTTLADFTRRLPTGLPAPRPVLQESCSLVGGTLINNVLTNARTVCNLFPIPVAPVLPAVETLNSESGRAVGIRTVVVADPNGGANHFRVLVGNGAMIEAADYGVKNGVIHTTDTLQIPSNFASLADMVGRR
jgi:uncharacterized surface protein with fasciclin (FAS1) repeats